MTLIQFLSYGLVPGNKYVLTLKQGRNGEHKTVTAYFNGYRFTADRKRAYLESDIVPVFNEVTKHGLMSSKHISDVTWLDRIELIKTPSDGTDYAIFRPEDLRSIALASDNIIYTARNQTAKILQEMSELFPGKKIFFDPDDNCPCTRFFKYTSECGKITAMRPAELQHKMEVDCDSESGMEIDIPYGDVEPLDEVRLLSTLIQRITDPYIPEKDAEESFVTASASWKDIPWKKARNAKKVLGKAGIIKTLAANLWFKALDDNGKKSALAKTQEAWESVPAEPDELWQKMDDPFKEYVFEFNTEH